MTATAPITGNTFPVKDQLKALGGRWDGAKKAWIVPAAKADEARALVASGDPIRAEVERRRKTYRRPGSHRYGWDGVRGSASYYSSGRYDEES